MVDSGTKNYVAVEFFDGTHSIVPRLWLSVKKNKFVCAWPSDEVSRRTITPPSPDWPQSKVKKLLAESSK